MKRVVTLCLFTALILESLCLYADRDDLNNLDKLDKLGEVQVATVTIREQSTVVREILARIITPERQTIAAETSGVVFSRRLEMGTAVSKGQVIVELDASEQQAILDIARRELEGAELELAHQTRSLERARVNRSQRVLSEARFDEFKTAHARAGVDRALTYGQVKLQETRLGKYQLKAPFSGELVRATPVPGGYVRTGEAVFELMNVRERRIALELTSSELASFLAGDYSLLYENRELTILSMSPAGDLNTGMTLIELDGRAEALRVGDSVSVKLVRVLYADIPKRGIQRDNQGEYVYVVSEGVVSRRELTDLQLGESVVVLSAGLIEAGDVVSSIRLDEES